MGLCGEAGEALEILKKVRYQGHKMDWRHVERELGDVAVVSGDGALRLAGDLWKVYWR